MATARIATFAEFWPFYLHQHARPGTRAWHYLGTSLTLLCLAATLATRDLWLAAVMVVAGYAPAWIGHFAVEKNRPATFRYPLWSLICDFRLYWTWLTGRLSGELAKAGVDTGIGPVGGA
jgi:hypothetical protein